MSLLTANLKLVYDSSTCDLVHDFLVPVLRNSVYYDRGVGYFTAGWLKEASAGMTSFAENGGKARWITSPILYKQDWEAIVHGDALKSDEYLKHKLQEEIKDLEQSLEQDTLTAISWMVADEILSFKIALPTGRLEGGDFHDKWGIFQDATGNKVCFSGSYNDSIKGSFNYESIKVFKSWDSSLRKFVDIDSRRFERLWTNLDMNVKVYDIPDAIKQKIISFKQENPRPYDFTKSSENKRAPKTPRAIIPRDYQQEAVRAWEENGHQGILNMATGTGKTITALLCLMELLQSIPHLFVILTCPYIHLVDQWAEVVQSFNIELTKCYENSTKWQPELKDKLQKLEMKNILNIKGVSLLMAITTNTTYTTNKFQEIIQQSNLPILLISDEVHHFGSPRQAKALLENAQYRLGLSATPERWYDDEGTQALKDYFKGIVYELNLHNAIYDHEVLCKYKYDIHMVELTRDEFEKYKAISLKIAAMLRNDKSETINEDNEALGHLLRERASILNNAEQKLPLLTELLDKNDVDHTLIYTSPQQILKVNKLLANKGIIAHQITYRETGKERASIINNFSQGVYQAITAIKCLDEGVDIPSIKTAYLLASTGNPREFTQRRGRILRKHPSKKMARIIDIVTIPTSNINDFGENSLWVEKAILRHEFTRLHYFAQCAENKAEAILKVYDMAKIYQVLNNLLGGHGGH